VALAYFAIWIAGHALLFATPIESVASAREQLTIESFAIGALSGIVVFGFISGLRLSES
jgi:hypothetical protein